MGQANFAPFGPAPASNQASAANCREVLDTVSAPQPSHPGGLADRRWTVEELFGLKLPPPPWPPLNVEGAFQ